ncbi:tau 95 subunit of transcription factor TFIIIC [Extremus antarcticus]|uniref:Tau 95 subunit of transcription factor TFIIIC n=1 Tax=Extremus antarcticus TaxID=702011 RepID=A0AAJ0GHJ5_9PEZI|nr:tau 95 subunit of transcription factor TFIIIC [Extremus antarcticus]
MAALPLVTDPAPNISVPPSQIVSIEHPCIIKNFQNGFKSLGGEQQLKHVLENDIGDSRSPDIKKGVEPVAGVSLRPDDPFAKKLSSTAVQTGNILVKVTVPKRTGRKRKRGSNEQYQDSLRSQDAAPTSITHADLLRRMQDNADNYKIEAIGVITDAHRFKTLPDFQIRADDVPIMRELRDHIMVPDYDKLKAFNLPAAVQDSSVPTPFPGPPSFLPTGRPAIRQTRQPKNYENIPAHALRDRAPGAPPAPQLRDLTIDHDLPQYPSGPKPDIPPRADIETVVKDILFELETALAKRPIYTRKAYVQLLRGHRETNIRRAFPYLAFYLSEGPWRNTVIKYGVDPRTDPKMRIYQTVSLSKAAAKAIYGPVYGKPSQFFRVFDGTTVIDPDGMFQLCDFTQPLLHRLVHESPVRAKADQKLGWYFNGTIAKIIVIFRDMLIQLANPDRETKMTDEDYEVLANLPDQVTALKECLLDPEHYGTHIRSLAEAIGDEAVYPTYTSIRGYEEVFPDAETKKPARPKRRKSSNLDSMDTAGVGQSSTPKDVEDMAGATADEGEEGGGSDDDGMDFDEDDDPGAATMEEGLATDVLTPQMITAGRSSSLPVRSAGGDTRDAQRAATEPPRAQAVGTDAAGALPTNDDADLATAEDGTQPTKEAADAEGVAQAPLLPDDEDDEDWTAEKERDERRKIQNRGSQRRYRDQTRLMDPFGQL